MSQDIHIGLMFIDLSDTTVVMWTMSRDCDLSLYNLCCSHHNQIIKGAVCCHPPSIYSNGSQTIHSDQVTAFTDVAVQLVNKRRRIPIRCKTAITVLFSLYPASCCALLVSWRHSCMAHWQQYHDNNTISFTPWHRLSKYKTIKRIHFG